MEIKKRKLTTTDLYFIGLIILGIGIDGASQSIFPIFVVLGLGAVCYSIAKATNDS